jgi:histidine triad (HIT) family protein
VESCIFCDILSEKIKSTPVYQDDQVYAFADIHPKAPVHILIIPRHHVSSVMDVQANDLGIFGALHAAAQKIARDKGLDSEGFRLIINNGANAGQAVSHLHLHLMGGRKLGWPPG